MAEYNGKYNLGSISNLLAVYELATEYQHDLGIRWYEYAHEWCKATAKYYDLNFKALVGVVACLSPQNSWKNNKEDTHLFIQEFNRGNRVAENIKVRTWNHSVWNAIKIMEGENPDWLLTSPKVRCFYKNILDPSSVDLEHITIDRWMWRCWVFDSKAKVPTINRGLYNRIAKDVRTAAEKVGLPPQQFQAICWLVIRKAGRGKKTCGLEYLERQMPLL